MFRNSYQSGFLSILYSIGSQPLSIWDRRVENGHIKRISDEDVKSQVVEITGTNVATTYIYCPQDPRVSLGVKLKFLVLIIKNLNKYFSFEITVIDNTRVRRRLRASNYQSTTRVRPFSCSMPMSLNPGWNQVQFNLADFTKRAYGTNYVETTRIQIHANCRIRRVYFADKLYTEDDVPPEYRLYVNDDPRTRRFSEPASALTSAAMTKAAMAGIYKPPDCSGLAAAPPTPCGGDHIREEVTVPPQKMQSFIGNPAPVSAEILPNFVAQETVESFTRTPAPRTPTYAGLKSMAAGPAYAIGSHPPSMMSGSSKPLGYNTPDSMVPMAGSRGPSSLHGPSKPSSSVTAGSQVPGASKQPSLSAATPNAPASGEKVASVTDAEPSQQQDIE